MFSIDYDEKKNPPFCLRHKSHEKSVNLHVFLDVVIEYNSTDLLVWIQQSPFHVQTPPESSELLSYSSPRDRKHKEVCTNEKRKKEAVETVRDA